MGDRYFKNTFVDFDEYKTQQVFSLESYKNTVTLTVSRLLDVLERQGSTDAGQSDTSIYTGSGGIALMYFKLALSESGQAVYGASLGCTNQARQGHDRSLLEKAYNIVVGQSRSNDLREFTFFCGQSGLLALKIVLQHLLGADGSDFYANLKLLSNYSAACVSLSSDEPDELLYGRAGYLYSLLFVEKHVGRGQIDSKLIKAIVNSIIESGEALASRLKNKFRRSLPPLMYEWDATYYLGAAHGLAGILYMLLEACEYLSDDALRKVRVTIDYLIGVRFPSGNYPSTLGSRSDRLVHWCHGAPGFIYLYAKAFEIFDRDTRYLAEARSCADLIWRNGLLKKGYGLCHGVAGNGYAFLRMYRLTGDDCYLYRACRFAEFCCAYGSHGCRAADCPYSLMEGMAGTICYLVDILSPNDARFPGFEL